jgi:integrase/recombinase XerC
MRRANGIPTPEDMLAVLRSFSRAPTAVRNRALLTVMYRAGLRVSEALDLEVGDLYPDLGEIHVRHGKGDEARITAMDDGAWEVLRSWLEIRRSLAGRRVKLVFCTLRGEPIADTYVRAMMRRKADHLGIPRSRFHPHALRHAFAVEMNREGKSTADIQRLLGHQSLNYTAIYLSRRGPKDAVAAVRAREWSI